jgi:hypothetical protein
MRMAKENEKEGLEPGMTGRQEEGREEDGGENKSEHRAGDKGESDLKEREYTDAEGNVRHHTKKYLEDEGSEGE